MRRLVPATGPLAGWDRDFTVGVALSTLLHAGVAVLVLWVASRAPAPPPPVESYTVELTDPSALGGRLAFGPLDRQIGRPRRIADAAGGAPPGAPKPGESPRGETVKPPKGAEPARPTRAAKPLAPVRPPAAVVADEPQLPRAAKDAVVVPPKPEAAKPPPPPKAAIEDAKAPPPKAAPQPKPAAPVVAQPEPVKAAAPAAKKQVRLPEPPKKMLELPRRPPEPKPQANVPVQQARATPTTVPAPPPAPPTTVPVPKGEPPPTTLPPPEPQAAPKPEPKAEPAPNPPAAQTAITSDEPSPAVATEAPTPAQPSWRTAGPKQQPTPRKLAGVADGAKDPSEKPMAGTPEPGAGSAPKPEPTAPAAGVEGTGTGGTAETPVQDPYAAAAERWRSRMAGAAGGMGGAPAPSGAIGDGTTDSGGDGSVVGFEFLSYRQRIFGTIKSNWTNTVRTPGLVAAVRFQLGPDGGVSAIELVRSSGDRVYDQAVVRAVQRSNPLPPPPERYRDDFREVIVDFHSEEGGSGQG